MIILKNLSQNIKFLRKKFKLTQDELAKKLNISRQVISYYENGTREPDLNIMINISKIFNCSLDLLLFSDLSKDNFLLDNILNFNLASKQNLIQSLKIKKNEIKDTLDKLNNFIYILENDNTCEFDTDISIIQDDIKKLTPNTVKVFDISKKVNNDFYNIPNIAPISAGYPSFTFDDIDKYFKIPKKYLPLGKDNYFILKVDGDSMNKLYKDGDYILVEKTSYVENNTPSIICIENDYATFKIFSKDENYIYLEPCSTNPKHQKQTYPLNKYKYRIIGKVLGVINEYE